MHDDSNPVPMEVPMTPQPMLDPAGLSRRSFLQSSFLGAAALGAAPMLFLPRFRDPIADGGFDYHPNLDPLRVVGIHDPKMTTETNPTAPWRTQQDLVNAEAVEQNIDRLACALTGEKRVKDAWTRIFLKPPGKAWSDVVVAIKTNNLSDQHTRNAVMAKICRVLTEEIGVKPEHVFIYDASHGRDMMKKTPFEGLPAGCNIAAKWGGFDGKTPLPRPWKEGKAETECLGHLVNGKIDILVNLALSKGHGTSYGGFTMTMKNHLGTFNPRPHAHREGRTEYLLAINRSPLVLGEIDEKKRRVSFPRQQLCLIDALWASEPGPGGNSTAQPNRLFMGTLPPVIDWVVARRFRAGTMGWEIHEPVVDRFLTEFGIASSQLPHDGKVLDAGEHPV
jgi:hypothetical protein